MIISNAKVIQKNETRINKIHPHKRKLLNFKIHKNKRNNSGHLNYSRMTSLLKNEYNKTNINFLFNS